MHEVALLRDAEDAQGGRRQGLLDRVLAGVELAVAAHEDAEDLRAQAAAIL